MLTTTLQANLQQAFLAALSTCGDQDLAAVCAESTPDEVRRTMRADVDFARAVATAKAKFVAGHVANVHRAGAIHWQASMAILERSPETRERWAPPSIKMQHTVLAVGAMSDSELLAALALDATPKDVIHAQSQDATLEPQEGALALPSPDCSSSAGGDLLRTGECLAELRDADSV